MAFRHEQKYTINRMMMDDCIMRLKEFAHLDSHAAGGGYSIRSLYFDDATRSAYIDKLDGVGSRQKYRIRIYDMSDGRISLEKKIKEGNYIRKESALLSRSEYDSIMRNDVDLLLGRRESLANDFALECKLHGLHPEVIVDYERVPYVYDYGEVRITFDMNVRAVFDDLSLFDNNAPSFEALDPGTLVMEVKYTQFLPDIFRAILPDETFMISASKYVMCEDVKQRFRGC